MNSRKDLFSKLGKLLQVPKISNSIKIAQIQHKGQLRDSGADYVEEHLYSIAINVIDRYKQHELLETLICVALLHDILEDTNFSEKELISHVGEEITHAVKVLTKTKKENAHGLPEAMKMKNNKRYLQRVAKGPVISKIIKMEDRIQNLSCIKKNTINIKPEKYKRYVYETRELFIPIAKELNGYANYAKLLESECKRVDKLFKNRTQH